MGLNNLKKTGSLSLLIALFCILGNSASACSCFYQKMSVKKIIEYDLVFSGKVIDKEIVNTMMDSIDNTTSSSFNIDYYKYSFKINRLISGIHLEDYVTIFSSTQSSACGVNYEIGDELYIYAYEYKGAYQTGLCSFNINLDEVNRCYKKIVRSFEKSKDLKNWKNIDNQLIATGKVVNKKAEGFWIFFHEDNTVESKGNFINGKRHGKWKSYHNKASSEEYFNKLEDAQKVLVKNKSNIIRRLEKYDHGELIESELILDLSTIL